MNTPGRSPSRILCLVAVLLCGLGSANGQTLTLQLPISRASHTFSLLELTQDSELLPQIAIAEGIDAFGISSGNYYYRNIPGFQAIGGTLDSSGYLIPLFLQGFIERTAGTGNFVVFDDTTGEVTHADTTNLLNAAWATPSGTDSVADYSLPAGRSGHQFLLAGSGVNPETQAGWSGWWQLTTMPPRTWFEADGTEHPFGFFEAWTYVPRGLQTATVYDITDYQYAIPSGSDLTGATWNSLPSGFWPAVSVFIATAQNGTFELISPGGAPQSVSSNSWSYTLSTYGVLVSVGFGREFWLRRPSDGQISPSYQVDWGTYSDPTEFDARASFAESPPTNWQTLHFRASPGRSPVGWQVRRTLDNTLTTIDWSPSGGYVDGPSGPGTEWVDWYEGWAYVNIFGGWAVMNGIDDLGQGPDFIDWPSFSGPTATLLLPRSRLGHALAAPATSVNYLEQYGIWNLFDAFTGETYQVTIDNYELDLPLSSYWSTYTELSIIDTYALDTSATFTVSNFNQASLAEWHAPGQLLLKISATRWSNNLQIRCGNGEVFPITKGRVQGDWSYSPSTGQSYFTSYGFYDAVAQYRLGVPWHLYDATRGVYLSDPLYPGATDFTDATDNTDSDGDSLPDWFERFIGTNPYNVDTDGDNMSDAYEVAHGTNPRAGSAANDPNATLIVFTPLK